jgi:uracil-DNA glycosylase
MSQYDEKTTDLYQQAIQGLCPEWLDFFHSQEAALRLKTNNLTALGQHFLPSIDRVFHIFKIIAVDEIKVIILGADPYPQADQATGLAFSINRNQAITQCQFNS